MPSWCCTGTTGIASGADFSADGRSVVSAGDDGMRITPCEVCGTLEDVLRVARTRAQHELMLAGVEAAALAATPLAVEQMRAGELHADAGAAQAVDRFAVEAVGGIAAIAAGYDVAVCGFGTR